MAGVEAEIQQRLLRAQRREAANQINLAAGSEGKFHQRQGARRQAVPELQKPAGEWNEWRVLAQVGDKSTFWCNGQQAWKPDWFTPAKGHIGIQAEGARIELKNLRIREIK